MKLLILTAFYRNPKEPNRKMFVHVRNLYYVEHGLDVTVLSFAASEDYEVDGIRVITLSSFERMIAQDKKAFDVAVCHAPNLRNHYRFLRRYEKCFARFVFFFHGHEVSILSKDYPEPYPWAAGERGARKLARDAYDRLKLKLWTREFRRLAPRSDFVFVSSGIRRTFRDNTGLSSVDLCGHEHIISNSVGRFFEEQHYEPALSMDYDFITIRSNLDGSTYCIDLLVELARKHPDRRFALIGKGRFFEFVEKPDNLEWIPRTLDHKTMKQYLDRSRCALMLTRHDTQGVMTCELAAYGMPVISSDIEVCHEFLDEAPNVDLVSNDVSRWDLEKVAKRLEQGLPYPADTRYTADNTIRKEVELFRAMKIG